MTVEERLTTLENTSRQQNDRLERHSVRLQKLEKTNQTVEEIKIDVSNMREEIKKMKAHQNQTDKKLLAKSNWTLALLFMIFGLILYIATKSPDTAKDIVDIAGKAVTTKGVLTIF